MRKLFSLVLFLAVVVLGSSCGEDDNTDQTANFRVTVTNIATNPVDYFGLPFVDSAGNAIEITYAPGVWVVHTGTNPLWSAFSPVDVLPGMESMAEDNDLTTLLAALPSYDGVISFGTFGSSPIGPGGSFTFEFSAQRGQHFSFASTLLQGNDIVLESSGGGLNPFLAVDLAEDIDFTSQLFFCDVGSEVNEPLGEGDFQVLTQAAPNTGPPYPEVDDPNILPAPIFLPISGAVANFPIPQGHPIDYWWHIPDEKTAATLLLQVR